MRAASNSVTTRCLSRKPAETSAACWCLSSRPAAADKLIRKKLAMNTALIEITENTSAHLAGIELDADRAAASIHNGIATVHGSTFECRVLAETCSLLYLNPPYDSEVGPHSNKRMELDLP